MSENKEELIKCAKCKCLKLKSLFKIRENTGILLKTCIKCCERHACDKCEYKCTKVSNLLQHIKCVHDKIKDIECEQCDYKCSAKCDLLKHIKHVHEKIQDFKCDQCDFKFGIKSNLKKHIKYVHSKIKDFECKDCDYKCSSLYALQSHIKRVHDKIKDFECKDCGLKCSAKSELHRHIKQVHDKIKDFGCKECEYKCAKNTDLKKHIAICTGTRNISGGEYKIIKCLEELKLIENEDYQFNSSHAELTKYCNRTLRFDFLFVKDRIVIEYDGKQHFEPTRFCGMSEEQAKKNFENLKTCDKLKDDFCKEKGYRMIRISYKEFPNILSILHKELIDVFETVG
jgi:very-short-patch-repair endonuclease